MTTPTSKMATEMATYWHSTTVEQRLASAAAVLRRLPGALPRTKLTSWPEVIHSTREPMAGTLASRDPSLPIPRIFRRWIRLWNGFFG